MLLSYRCVCKQLFIVFSILSSIVRDTNSNSEDDVMSNIDKNLKLVSEAVENLRADFDKLQGKAETYGKELELVPVIPVEVRLSPENNVTTCSIKYRTFADNVKVTWADYDGEISGSTTTRLSEGLWSTTSKMETVEAHSEVFVTFTSDELKTRIGAVLTRPSKEIIQTNISVPIFEIEPSGDLVYERGKDVYFKVKVYKVGGQERILFLPSLTIIDLETGTGIFNSHRNNSFIETIKQNDFEKYTVHHLKIKTSEHRISGLVNIITERSHAFNWMVQLYMFQLVVLRPSTQDGPWPQGYLSLTNDFFGREKLNGSDKRCLIDEKCLISCAALGENIEKIKLERLAPGDSRETIPTAPEPLLSSEYFRIENVVVLVKSADVERENYVCSATNAAGKTERLAYSVLYTLTTNILRNLSHIEVVSNEQDSNRSELRIVCVVQGRPQPQVTFYVNIPGVDLQEAEPDEIVSLGQYKFKAIKTVTIDSSNDLQDPDSIAFWYASCSARQGSGHDHGSYDYYMFDSIPGLDVAKS